jgi:hypothetical protein
MWLDVALVYWLCFETTLDSYISLCKSNVKVAMAKFNAFSNI